MLKLDTWKRDPIYSQLEKQIVKLINLGVYEKDSILPSVRSVACDLAINPNTVAKAYKNLEQMGVIYSVAGKGVFVKSGGTKAVHDLAREKTAAVLTNAKNAGLKKDAVIKIIDEIWRDSK